MVRARSLLAACSSYLAFSRSLPVATSYVHTTYVASYAQEQEQEHISTGRQRQYWNMRDCAVAGARGAGTGTGT